MKRRKRVRWLDGSVCACVVGLVIGCVLADSASAQWPQWGGPQRNFKVETQGLADKWAEDGPRKLWHRELGDGYATIVVDDGTLFTMYRKGEDEFTVSLDAKTGQTIWEHKNPSPTTKLMRQFGPGPHSTPLVFGDRVYTVGTHAVLHCFDQKSGRVVWKHDLPKDFGAPVPGRGYGCSPIVYENLLILPVGREGDGGGNDREEPVEDGQSLIAFDRLSGSTIWKSQAAALSYASPIIIDFEGQAQLVQLLAQGIMGVAPASGARLWHLPLTPPGANIATPVWDGKDTLFCSSAYDSGSRGVKLTKQDGTTAEQSWYSRKLRIHHGNAVRIGDYVYASSGDFGPAFFACLSLKTGKVAWRERGFSKATCVYGDGKLILLDEDGTLALTTVSPEGLTVHSRCKVAERYAWAAPTLVDRTLYVRDRKHIMALDLASPGTN